MVLGLEKEILKGLQERLVKSFLDELILAQLRKEPKSGYDVIALVHRKFHLLMSSGTVYSTLYALERDGSIQGNWAQRKRVYTLTDKGKKTIQTILNANDKIQLFVANLLGNPSE